MFQDTTENIVNDPSIISVETVHADNALLLDGIGLFYKANIQNVTVAPYVPAAKEKLTIAMPAYTSGDVIRLKITTSQEGITSPIYADAQLRHKKPFFYEIISEGNAVADTTNLVKLINKEMSYTDFNFFTAKQPDDGASPTPNLKAEIVLTADDCYTRFQTIQVAKIEHQKYNYTGFEDYTVTGGVEWKRADAKGVAGTAVNNVTVNAFGTEGAGTVARLIKNLRVPTDANTDTFAADNGGRPIPGGKYNQFVFEYVTERRHIGGQVMGALDKSITTHVIFAAGGNDNSTIPTKADNTVSGALMKAFDALTITVNPANSKAPTTVIAKVTPKVGSKQ